MSYLLDKHLLSRMFVMLLVVSTATPVRSFFLTRRHSALLLLLSAFLSLSFLSLSSSSSASFHLPPSQLPRLGTPLSGLILFTFSSPPHLFLSSPLPVFLPSTDALPYGRWANGLAGPLRPVGCAVWLSPGALHLAGSTSSRCQHLWVTYSLVSKKRPVYVKGHKWATSTYDNNNVLKCVYLVWRLNLSQTGHLTLVG